MIYLNKCCPMSRVTIGYIWKLYKINIPTLTNNGLYENVKKLNYFIRRKNNYKQKLKINIILGGLCIGWEE